MNFKNKNYLFREDTNQGEELKGDTSEYFASYKGEPTEQNFIQFVNLNKAAFKNVK